MEVREDIVLSLSDVRGVNLPKVALFLEEMTRRMYGGGPRDATQRGEDDAAAAHGNAALSSSHSPLPSRWCAQWLPNADNTTPAWLSMLTAGSSVGTFAFSSLHRRCAQVSARRWSADARPEARPGGAAANAESAGGRQ